MPVWPLAHGTLYVHLRAWRNPARLARSAPPLEVHAAVLPATRPCSGCRLPPVVRLRPYQRPRYSLGRPGGLRVVFRRDSKVDAFQRQISALRHQLGGENDDEAVPDLDRPPLFERGILRISRSTPISPSTGPNVPLLPRAHRFLGLETCPTRLLHRSQQSTSRPVSSLSQPRGGAISSRAVRCTSMAG